jgi:exosome complex RNA-binding protein Rrp42 (RNase PH superfamily)
MSSTNTWDLYTINIQGVGVPIGQLVLNSQSGVTDTLALAVAAALKALTWPTGTTFQMQKDTMTDVNYGVDFAVTPLSFA